ncbi:MAG: helix-turn-helix domain-containing protein [Luteibacter sp.]
MNGHRYLEHELAAGDDACVEALWETSILAAGTYVVLPDGRMDLVLRCDHAGPVDTATVAGIAIIGPSSRPAAIPVEAGQRFIGVRFRPGFGACLGVDPASLVDSALRGNEATKVLGDVSIDILEARGLTNIRAAFRDMVKRRTSLAPPLPSSTMAAITLLHDSAGRASVAELSAATGVPDRTLRRRMRQAVGLPPKVFAGVLRFQHAMRRLQGDDPPSLVDVAADCGYSDQAHLTREFQRFGGFTPGQRLPATLVTLPLGGVAD